MRRRAAGLLPGLVLASGLAGVAHAADPLVGICRPDDLTLFACVLKTHDQVGFCLNKADLKTRFVVRTASGSQAASPANDLRAATIGGNAHGDIVTVHAETAEGSVAIYVDFIADDLEAPVLVTDFAKQERKEPCATPDFDTETVPVFIRGAQRVVRLVDLVGSGIAKPLTPVPEWPN